MNVLLRHAICFNKPRDEPFPAANHMKPTAHLWCQALTAGLLLSGAVTTAEPVKSAPVAVAGAVRDSTTRYQGKVLLVDLVASHLLVGNDKHLDTLLMKPASVFLASNEPRNAADLKDGMRVAYRVLFDEDCLVVDTLWVSAAGESAAAEPK